MKLLVVGGDSLIGGELMRRARALAWSVTGTTRRLAAADRMLPELEILDLATLDLDNGVSLPAGSFDVVVLCAAHSRHEQCTRDPRAAERVNVEAPVRLAREAAQRGAHVMFLSTDSVFGENNCLRREADPVVPGTRIYPVLKARAETLLAQTVPAGQLAIVRLTKVVSVRREPFATWCRALRTGARIEGFSDLLLSPISLRYVSQALLQIGASRAAGLFHLSGERDLSYAEFAWEVSAQAGGGAVASQSMAQAGVLPSYRPAHSTLGMQVTTDRTGLRPQPATLAVQDLLAEAGDLDPVKEAPACVTAA